MCVCVWGGGGGGWVAQGREHSCAICGHGSKKVPSRPVLRGKYLLKLTCPMGTGPDKSSSTEVIN